MTSVPGQPNGLLVVDKPSGPTSYDLIRWLKRRVKGVKIGHCGTLDPMASGVMILLLGRATKAQSRLMGCDKTYRWRMRLGVRTDTGDITGNVVESRAVDAPTEERFAEVLRRFLGERDQIPPMYSALKKNGTPLYKLARRGEFVEREPRRIRIDSAESLGRIGNDEWEGRVRCSAGTYVRTLMEEIAAELGTVGTLAALVRESVGEWNLSLAMPGERLRSGTDEELLSALRPTPEPS